MFNKTRPCIYLLAALLGWMSTAYGESGHIYSEWASAYRPANHMIAVGAMATYEYRSDLLDQAPQPISGLFRIILRYPTDLEPTPDLQKFKALILLIQTATLTRQDAQYITCDSRPAQKGSIFFDNQGAIPITVECTPKSNGLAAYFFPVTDKLIESMRTSKEMRIVLEFQPKNLLLARLKLNTFDGAFTRLLSHTDDDKKTTARLWDTDTETEDPLDKIHGGR